MFAVIPRRWLILLAVIDFQVWHGRC